MIEGGVDEGRCQQWGEEAVVEAVAVIAVRAVPAVFAARAVDGAVAIDPAHVEQALELGRVNERFVLGVVVETGVEVSDDQNASILMAFCEGADAFPEFILIPFLALIWDVNAQCEDVGVDHVYGEPSMSAARHRSPAERGVRYRISGIGENAVLIDRRRSLGKVVAGERRFEQFSRLGAIFGEDAEVGRFSA